jgi:hypothetical protein
VALITMLYLRSAPIEEATCAFTHWILPWTAHTCGVTSHTWRLLFLALPTSFLLGVGWRGTLVLGPFLTCSSLIFGTLACFMRGCTYSSPFSPHREPLLLHLDHFLGGAHLLEDWRVICPRLLEYRDTTRPKKYIFLHLEGELRYIIFSLIPLTIKVLFLCIEVGRLGGIPSCNNHSLRSPW